MKNTPPSNEKYSRVEVRKSESDSITQQDSTAGGKQDSNTLDKPGKGIDIKADKPTIIKKTSKPPKIEDKPFVEFIDKHLIPGLKSKIEEKGALVTDIKLLEGQRPVVGGNCWMIACEISEQRKFWLCFSNDVLTSDKTILLAESNSDPCIVESFLIDERKTTLPLLISRVLQRLNGQKWIGAN